MGGEQGESLPPKRLLVVGGPNGSGKTTLANAYLEQGGWLYLGADKIAAEICPERPESVAAAAGRGFVEQFDQALHSERRILVESTLSGRSIGRNFERARNLGFRVEIAFTFVDAPATSIARVAQRVRTGGHFVPDEDVIRRFYRSIRNFWLQYRLVADLWTLFDNRFTSECKVAFGDTEKTQIIHRQAMSEFLSIVEGDHV
ncbi:Zeta toxin [Botrimarina colliarenosi]|uniref:Zeta toxin n=1 Tax=Botrimarina colliarenosi TaxID=2528001 RepID=A0A5C6AJ75_9BACT|nr:AAA family ATPase [Botrimarina colliarenosi]TWU00075.1 Zeta toxin [Botrimarina colliarenosi]